MKGGMALFDFGLLRTSHWKLDPRSQKPKARIPNGRRPKIPQAQKPEIPEAKYLLVQVQSPAARRESDPLALSRRLTGMGFAVTPTACELRTCITLHGTVTVAVAAV
jgi:hypothetical protein